MWWKYICGWNCWKYDYAWYITCKSLYKSTKDKNTKDKLTKEKNTKEKYTEDKVLKKKMQMKFNKQKKKLQKIKITEEYQKTKVESPKTKIQKD